MFDVPGDLICSSMFANVAIDFLEPFPVMPVSFWDDEKNDKYRNAYFSKYDGIVFW